MIERAAILGKGESLALDIALRDIGLAQAETTTSSFPASMISEAVPVKTLEETVVELIQRVLDTSYG